MPTGAISAHGTLLKQGDGGTPEGFATIAEVRNISGPGLSLDTEEVTAQTSPGHFREFAATLLQAGEISFEINFIPTAGTHSPTTGLISLMINRTRRNFQLVFPDVPNTTWLCPCLVTGFEPSAPVDGILSASVTLQVVGQPTLT